MAGQRTDEVLELVVFSLKDGVTRDQLIDTVDAVSEWASGDSAAPLFVSFPPRTVRARFLWSLVVDHGSPPRGRRAHPRSQVFGAAAPAELRLGASLSVAGSCRGISAL
ncbi:hypothetical protein NOGI109294_12535 [Nocardiopsis gilva]